MRRINCYSGFCLWAFLCHCCFGGDELPSLSDVKFLEPTDEQLERLEEYVANLEAISVANDAFMVECTGTRAYSQTKGQRLIIVDYSFIFAENAERKIRRYICNTAKVLDETPRNLPNQKTEGPGLLAINSDHRDLMIFEKDGEQKAIFSRGGRGIPQSVPDGTSPLKLLSGSIIFNPTCACLNSVMELTDPRLSAAATFGGYKRKLVDGFGTKSDLEVGRWLFKLASTKLTKTPKDFGLIRAIAFRDGRPVIVEDRVGLTSKAESIPLYSRTEISWEQVGEEMRPARIYARTGKSQSLQIEFEGTLKWYLDDKIPAEIFQQESLGKIGFSSSEVN